MVAAERGAPVKLFYKPFGILAGVIGGLIATAAFKRVWSLVGDENDVPVAKNRRHGWSQVVAAAALQGAITGGVKALADRAGAAGYERATGVWPGDDGPA
jgi:Protein of unknown function (DUF4235)